MRSFPKHINTRQDFVNLFSIPEFRAQALIELKHARDTKDSKITKASTQKDPEDPESEWNTVEVVNPNPKWKRLQFKTKKELTDMVASVEAIPNGKQKAN